MSKRMEWVDALKGFGIFCVTFGHLGCNILLEKHIYSFHMFLFFSISGFLYKNTQSSLKEYIVKKLKTLLVPFICWDVLSTIIDVCLNMDLAISIKKMLLINGNVCWNAPIWFLWIICITQILYAVLKKYLVHCNFICIIISAICWYMFAETKSFLMLNLLPISLFFYSLGNIYKSFSEKYSNIYETKPYLVFVCIILILINLFFGVLLNIRISFTGASFGNIIYCMIAAISGVLFYIVVFQNFNKLSQKSLIYLGKNSLIIMAMQYWLFNIYDIFSINFFNVSICHLRSTLKALLITIVSVVIICLIAETIKCIGKKVKFIDKFGKLFGIR